MSYLSKGAYFNLPYLHLVPYWADNVQISLRFVVPKNGSPWAIMWRCLHDAMFCLFDTMIQGDHSPDTMKFPDISLTMRGTHAHVKWYS